MKKKKKKPTEVTMISCVTSHPFPSHHIQSIVNK